MADGRRAPVPADEAARLAAVQALGLLDAAAQPEIDCLVRAASLVCDAPIALLTLIDQDRQFLLGNFGLGGFTSIPREDAFCAHAIIGRDLFEIEDACEDARFAGNPLVVGPPGIRFYAGAPVMLEAGAAAGALCVIDRRPRRLDPKQRQILQCLALAASHALEGWRLRQGLAEANQLIEQAKDRFRRFYEATPAMLHSLAPDGVLLTVSDAWLARLGYLRHEVIGRDVAEFLAAPAQAPDWEAPDWMAQGWEAQGWEARGWEARGWEAECVAVQMRAKSGETVNMQARAMLEPDPAGQPLHRLCVLQDVGGRLAAERALADERVLLGKLIASNRIGTAETVLATGACIVNARWAEIVGQGLADLTPLSVQTVRGLIHADDLPPYDAVMARLLAGSVAHFEIDLRLRHAASGWVWTLCRGTHVARRPDGLPERVFTTLEDISARKEHEEALRKSEEFLARAGEVAGVGAWELDIASEALTWSAETRRIHGVGPEFQPTLESAVGFYAPEARSVIRQAVENSIAGNGGWDLELPMIRANGRPVWVRAVGSTTLADGKPHRLTGAFQDITERRVERLALQKANERLTLATDSGGIGIWDWDIVSGRIEWDPWMYRLHGMEPFREAVDDALWRRLLHPEDRAAVEAASRRAIEGTKPFDAEFRIVRADGSLRHLRASASVTRAAAGKPLHMIGATWDVTDQRRLAAELAEKHDQLRVTLQSIGDGVITTDSGGRIVWLNPVAERMTGWASAEAVGLPAEQVFNIVDQDSRQKIVAPIAACLADGAIAARPGRTLLLSRTGEVFPVEDSAAPIRGDAGPSPGSVLGVVLVFHDVTAQRRLEDERAARELALQDANAEFERARDAAERASRAKSRFLAGMSHELRTPLNGVLGYAQLLRADGGLSAVQTARVEAMVAAGTHLLGMINSVLDLTEIEQERTTLHPADTDCHALCAECCEMMAAAAQAKGLQLRLEIAPGASRHLTTDPVRLRQILLNLLGNAVKFTPSGRVLLRLHAGADAARLCFEVSDTGPGIPADRQSRLFKEFDRLDLEATSSIEGAGLGLALSFRFAALIGGRLSYANHPGGGSLFTLELPLPPANAQLSTQPDAAEAPVLRAISAGQLRVLVVDDVAVNRDIARGFLAMAGHVVTCAESGADAVALVAAQDFDVVLMDVRMPAMDGLEATRRIRAGQRPRAAVPIIGLTARAFTEQVAACGRAGMDGHLCKPYDLDALQAAVADAARRRPAEAEGRTFGAELPLLDHDVIGQLTECLPRGAVETYMRSVGDLGRDLLYSLRRPQALQRDAGTLSGAAHRLAGSAGMLGFERLAKVGLHFERAMESGAAEMVPLAGSLDAAIEATLGVIEGQEWRRT